MSTDRLMDMLNKAKRMNEDVGEVARKACELANSYISGYRSLAGREDPNDLVYIQIHRSKKEFVRVTLKDNLLHLVERIETKDGEYHVIDSYDEVRADNISEAICDIYDKSPILDENAD